MIKVYKVDNGEVFFEHDHTNVSVELAQKMFEEGKFENAYCKVEKGVKCYYDEKGKFIGNAGVHIRDEYNEFQEYIYLVRNDDESGAQKIINKMFNRTVK